MNSWAARALGVLDLACARLNATLVFDRYRWQPEGPEAPPPPAAGWEAVDVDASNVHLYPDPSVADDLRQLLRTGHHGLFVRIDGKVAGRYWWQAGPGPVLGRGGLHLFDLGPREAYVHHGETRPEWEGRGVFLWATAVTLARIRSRGFDAAWGLVRPDNPASGAWLRHGGFRLHDRLEVTCRLGRMRRRSEPPSPRPEEACRVAS